MRALRPSVSLLRYKKNLKALYVVHPTNFIKILWTILKPLVRYEPFSTRALLGSDSPARLEAQAVLLWGTCPPPALSDHRADSHEQEPAARPQ